MHRCFRRVLLATFDRLECVRRVTQRGTMHEAIDSIGNVERISTIDQFIDRAARTDLLSLSTARVSNRYV